MKWSWIDSLINLSIKPQSYPFVHQNCASDHILLGWFKLGNCCNATIYLCKYACIMRTKANFDV